MRLSQKLIRIVLLILLLEAANSFLSINSHLKGGSTISLRHFDLSKGNTEFQQVFVCDDRKCLVGIEIPALSLIDKFNGYDRAWEIASKLGLKLNVSIFEGSRVIWDDVFIPSKEHGINWGRDVPHNKDGQKYTLNVKIISPVLEEPYKYAKFQVSRLPSKGISYDMVKLELAFLGFLILTDYLFMIFRRKNT